MDTFADIEDEFCDNEDYIEGEKDVIFETDGLKEESVDISAKVSKI